MNTYPFWDSEAFMGQLLWFRVWGFGLHIARPWLGRRRSVELLGWRIGVLTP